MPSFTHHLHLATTEQTTKGVERLCLHAIAAHADEDGEAWPSYATIGQYAAVGPSTAARAVAVLEERGLITRVRRSPGHPAGYRLLLAEATPATPTAAQMPSIRAGAQLQSDLDREDWSTAPPATKRDDDDDWIAYIDGEEYRKSDLDEFGRPLPGTLPRAWIEMDE